MKKLVLSLIAIAMSVAPVFAQSKRYNVIKADTAKVHYIHRDNPDEAYIMNANERKNTVYVNEQVTTHIIMPENIKMVDISTNAIIGNQCADNIVRIKPASRMYDHELAGTMTVIGERHIAQFNVVYVKGPAKANSIYNIDIRDTKRYENPDVSMPEASMAQYAWAISNMPSRFHNIKYKKYGIKGVVNNIYSIGDYFFIDFSLYNSSKIRYDVAEIRVKLSDKKETKATNSQTIELSPVYTLNPSKSFMKGYRNVIVLDKLTFPDEKVLTIEVSENQISGRVLYIPIEYNDVLNADGFDERLMKSICTKPYPDYSEVVQKVKVDDSEYRKLQGEMDKLQDEYEQVKAEKEQLVKELDNRRQSLNLLDSQIASKKEYLKSLTDKSVKLEGKIKNLRELINNINKFNTNDDD